MDGATWSLTSAQISPLRYMWVVERKSEDTVAPLLEPDRSGTEPDELNKLTLGVFQQNHSINVHGRQQAGMMSRFVFSRTSMNGTFGPSRHSSAHLPLLSRNLTRNNGLARSFPTLLWCLHGIECLFTEFGMLIRVFAVATPPYTNQTSP